jgi:hypothetical protein
LRKATISFMSVCPSVRMEQQLPLGGAWRKLLFELFSKNCRVNLNLIKIRRESRVLYMKTFSHLRQYLVKFFLEWEMFYTKLVEKIKTNILCSITFFRKSCRLWDNVEKYSGNRGATNDVTIWRIRVACWISKTTCTHARAHTQICNTYWLFHGSSGYVNAPQYYVIHTLSVLLFFSVIFATAASIL